MEEKKIPISVLIERAYRNPRSNKGGAFTAEEMLEAWHDAKNADGGMLCKEAYKKAKGDTFKVTVPARDKRCYYGIIFNNGHFDEIKTYGRTVIMRKYNQELVDAYPDLYSRSAEPTDRDLHEDIRNSSVYRRADITEKVYLELAAEHKHYDMQLDEERLLITLKSSRMSRFSAMITEGEDLLILEDATKGYTAYPDGTAEMAKEYYPITRENIDKFDRHRKDIEKILLIKERIKKKKG